MGFLSKNFLMMKDLDELRVIHEETTQKIKKLEDLKEEWAFEEEVIREKEANIEWAKNFVKIVYEDNKIQINQINAQQLTKIIKENIEVLIEQGE